MTTIHYDYELRVPVKKKPKNKMNSHDKKLKVIILIKIR